MKSKNIFHTIIFSDLTLEIPVSFLTKDVKNTSYFSLNQMLKTSIVLEHRWQKKYHVIIETKTRFIYFFDVHILYTNALHINPTISRLNVFTWALLDWEFQKGNATCVGCKNANIHLNLICIHTAAWNKFFNIFCFKI